MILLSLFFSLAWTLFVLFIWFKTDFLLYYGEALGLSSKLKIPTFRKLQKQKIYSNFLFFLSVQFKHHPFLKFPVKLITCLYCFAFWVSLFVSMFYSIEYLPLNYLGSLLIFYYIEKYEQRDSD